MRTTVCWRTPSIVSQFAGEHLRSGGQSWHAQRSWAVCQRWHQGDEVCMKFWSLAHHSGKEESWMAGDDCLMCTALPRPSHHCSSCHCVHSMPRCCAKWGWWGRSCLGLIYPCNWPECRQQRFSACSAVDWVWPERESVDIKEAWGQNRASPLDYYLIVVGKFLCLDDPYSCTGGSNSPRRVTQARVVKG